MWHHIPDAPSVEDTTDMTNSETRSSGKSKKRAPWKTKTDFTHPWLLKSLKGHPGTVLHVDFSPNGKFLAATCEGNCIIVLRLWSCLTRTFCYAILAKAVYKWIICSTFYWKCSTSFQKGNLIYDSR